MRNGELGEIKTDIKWIKGGLAELKETNSKDHEEIKAKIEKQAIDLGGLKVKMGLISAIGGLIGALILKWIW